MLNINARPDFVTFTGADDATLPVELAALARRWGQRIEFAFLYSIKKEGRANRYPSIARLDDLISAVTAEGGRTAVHYCGEIARKISDYGSSSGAPLFRANRVQLNLLGHDVSVANCRAWAGGRPIILQCGADGFPDNPQVSWLFDTSGGRGRVPVLGWPSPPDKARGHGRRFGYAGGLRPGSDWEAIGRAAVGQPYWLDMETGVRNRTTNQFDIKLCERVMLEVYGGPYV